MNLKDILDRATPGPWLLSYSGNFVVTEDALVIAETGTYQMPKENARLIALAPELAAEVLELRERHREAMALALDMGAKMAHFEKIGPLTESGQTRSVSYEALSQIFAPLLARLDRIGKEQTT